MYHSHLHIYCKLTTYDLNLKTITYNILIILRLSLNNSHKPLHSLTDDLFLLYIFTQSIVLCFLFYNSLNSEVDLVPSHVLSDALNILIKTNTHDTESIQAVPLSTSLCTFLCNLSPFFSLSLSLSSFSPFP